MVGDRRLILELDFPIGSIVYAKVSTDAERGMVTAVRVDPNGVTYYVEWESGTMALHYAMELSTEFVPDYEHEGA